MDGRDADGTAAGRRLAEALRAQASFASGPAPAPPRPVPPQALGDRSGPLRGGAARQHQGPHARVGASGALPTVTGPRPPAGPPSARTTRRRWSGPTDLSARVRLALLVVLLVGVLLGCALAGLSVLLPGLFPAIG